MSLLTLVLVATKNIAQELTDDITNSEKEWCESILLEDGPNGVAVAALVVAFISLLVAILSFLFSQFSLSARVKRIQDLEQFARRYHDQYPEHLNKDKDGGVSPVKDALVEYRRTFDNLHSYATLGLGRIIMIITVSLFPAFLLIFYGGIITTIIGGIWLVATAFIGTYRHRFKLDKELKNIQRNRDHFSSSLRNLLGDSVVQFSEEKDKKPDSEAEGEQDVSKLGFVSFLAFLILVFFLRKKIKNAS